MLDPSPPQDSPRLARIEVRDYRCFVQQTLQLRPLTLLYGYNGTGKSAFARLLGMIAQSIEPDADRPLDPSGEIGGYGKAAELVWKGKSTTQQTGFWLTLGWSGSRTRTGLCSATWHIDTDLKGRQFVSSLHLQRRDGDDIWSATTQGTAGEFAINKGPLLTSPAPVEPIRFAGLVPDHTAAPPQELSRRLQALRGRIRWLGTQRPQVPRRFDPTTPLKLAVDGAGSIEILHSDSAALAVVRQWYARDPIGRHLDFSDDGSLKVPSLRPRGGGFDVAFADAGAGLNHALPLLTAAALAVQDSSLFVAEEPETHLHTNAQRALAEWFCERVLADDPPTLVLETHSAVFIAAVQLAIARNPDLRRRIGVYWFETDSDGSSASPFITFDAHGRPEGGGWPRDAFADQMDLARQLIDLRLRRGV